MSPPSDAESYPTAGLLRRVGAMIYDGMLVLALWMTTLFVVVGLNRGEYVFGALIQSLLFLELFAFFALSWVAKGHTLGMMAWRLRVETQRGEQLTLNQATLRFIGAMLAFASVGIGYLWCLFDTNGRTWPDLLSRSRLVVVPRAAFA